MTNGVDYWRDLYDLFRCCARGHRLVPAHVRLCDSGGNLGPGWYIFAGVHSAIPGKHAPSPLGGWVFCKWDDRLADWSEPFSLFFRDVAFWPSDFPRGPLADRLWMLS